MRCTAFLVLLLPAVALAQSPSPSDPATSPSDPTPDPTVSTAPGATTPNPNPAQPVDDASTMLPNPADPGSAPDGYRRLQSSPTYPPPRGMNLPGATDEQYTPPERQREGKTLEAAIGMGWQHAAADYAEPTTHRGLPSVSLGAGTWLRRSLAFTVRLSTISVDPAVVSGLQIHAFAGPALQWWLTDSIWIGAGVGVEMLIKTHDDGDDGSFGPEARAGYTFNPGSKHSVNASIEVLSTRFASTRGSVDFTGLMTSVGVWFGYQLL